LAKLKNLKEWMQKVEAVKEVAEVTAPMLKLAGIARKKPQPKL